MLVICGIDLYGCESLSVTPKEEHKLRLSEERVLKRLSGPKTKEVGGNWKQLHT